MSNPKSEARSGRYLFQITSHFTPTLNLSVQSVPVPGVTLNTLDMYVGGRSLAMPDNNISYDPIVVSFLVSEDLSEWWEVYNWMLQASADPEHYYDYEHDCKLTILDSQNQPIIQFTYFACVPTSLDAIALTYIDDSRVLTSSLSLSFSTMKAVNLKTADVLEDL